jgi:putative membrane protein insertion efficiency factor
MLKKATLRLIKSYQKTLSRDHGLLKKHYPYGYCRFNPSCSQYTYEAVDRFGIMKGLLLGFWRILRCNPWSRGGNDPVPKTFSFRNQSGAKSKKNIK